MTAHQKYTYCIYGTESCTDENGTTYKSNEIIDSGFVYGITSSPNLYPKLFDSPEEAENYGRKVLFKLEKKEPRFPLDTKYTLGIVHFGNQIN